jgi:hypothetical protein
VITSSSPSLKSPNPSSDASTSDVACVVVRGAEGTGMPSAPNALGYREEGEEQGKGKRVSGRQGKKERRKTGNRGWKKG